MRTNCGMRTELRLNAVIVVAALTAVAGCRSAARPRERPVPAPAPAAVVTAEPDEYAIYSAILRPRFGEVIVRDSTLANAPVVCLEDGRLSGECARRDKSKAALEMWSDYAARNAQRRVLVKRFAPDIHITLARDWKGSRQQACAGPTTLEFSRVGFDRARKFALVTVKSTQGAGPYPGCGFGSTTTLVYERSRSGGWKVRYFIGGLIN
jgi:hypothetical protein